MIRCSSGKGKAHPISIHPIKRMQPQQKFSAEAARLCVRKDVKGLIPDI